MNAYCTLKLYELNNIKKELCKMKRETFLKKAAGYIAVLISFICLAGAAENELPKAMLLSTPMQVLACLVGILLLIAGVVLVVVHERKARILSKRLSEISSEIATRKHS